MIPIAKPQIGEEEKRRVLDVLSSGIISSGKVVEEFERAFAQYIGSKYAVATSSGTSALHLALLTSGIREGDYVLTTPFTFIATANSILHCRAKPFFCDVDYDTFNISPEAIEKALKKNPKIRAILIVHLYGHPCDMEPIMEIVKKHKLVLVEDCAQAHGSKYGGKHVGTFGITGIFSFYPTKNITTAEGGMVVTDDEEVYKKLKLLREHGMTGAGKYDYTIVGYNYRMTNIEAAIGLAQLEKLDEFNKARRDNAQYFNQHLKGIPWLATPIEKDRCYHVYHQYTLKVKDRDRFVEHLKGKGIGCKVYYPSLITDSDMYREIVGDVIYPTAKKLTKEVVSIPVHPAVGVKERKEIVDAICSFVPEES